MHLETLIVVAVVDGGMMLTHTDLVPNLWTNYNEIPAIILMMTITVILTIFMAGMPIPVMGVFLVMVTGHMLEVLLVPKEITVVWSLV